MEIKGAEIKGPKFKGPQIFMGIRYALKWDEQSVKPLGMLVNSLITKCITDGKNA